MTLERDRNSKIIVESDLANAVLWCNGENNGPWNITFTINLIRCAINSGKGVEIVYKCRESNIHGG